MTDEHINIYRIDAHDEYVNGAYDDDGNGVECERCSGELFYRQGKWCCRDCGHSMSRMEYFNYIGAEPPGSDCFTNCNENYPLCKKYCTLYEIDPNDPMLD